MTDLPYLKVHFARKLKFNHESIWGIKYHSWKIHTEEERKEQDESDQEVQEEKLDLKISFEKSKTLRYQKWLLETASKKSKSVNEAVKTSREL